MIVFGQVLTVLYGLRKGGEGRDVMRERPPAGGESNVEVCPHPNSL